MDIEGLKATIKEQSKLVQVELQSTASGYTQALSFVLGLLEKDSTKTVNSGQTVTVESK